MKGTIFIYGSSMLHNALDHWTELLCNLFSKKGFNACKFSLSENRTETLSNMEKLLSSGLYDTVFVFNGSAVFSIFQDLFEKYDVSLYNYLLDHPAPIHQPLLNAFGKYNAICVDRFHRDYVKHYFPKVKHVYFLPLAGMSSNIPFKKDIESFSERPYNLIFTGGVTSTEIMLNGLISTYPEHIKNVTLSLIEYMISNPELSPEIALKDMLNLSDISDERYRELSILTSGAIFFIRNYTRERIISSLLENGIRVDVFGNGWEFLSDRFPKFSDYFHGEISITESIDINLQSKIVLNVMPWFKAGTHDRIETAQLNGAAVLTDDSIYLRELYKDDENIFFYDVKDPDSLADRISKILSSPETIYKVATNGRILAENSMTWDHLADKLISIMNNS